jgi:hypothetical protein
VIPTGYLGADYTDFNAINEPTRRLRVDEAAIATLCSPATADAASTTPIVFLVSQPVWRAEDALVGRPEERENVLFTLRERTYRYLLRQYPSPTRARYAITRQDSPVAGLRVLEVRLAVTHATEGSGFWRYVGGWGTGRVTLQVEGAVLDHGDNMRPIVEFAAREWHAGYAQTGFNTDVLQDDYVMRYAAEEIIASLALEIARRVPGVLGQPPPQPMPPVEE